MRKHWCSRLLFWMLSMGSTMHLAACRATHGNGEAPRSPVASGPRQGRYLGYGRLAAGDAKIPVLLDLIATSKAGPKQSYRAILRLSLGGFAGQEYAAVYFSDVSYDHDAKLLVFRGGPDNLGLTTTELNPEGFVGTLAVPPPSGPQGQAAVGPEKPTLPALALQLKFNAGSDEAALAQAIFPDLPVMRPVTGSYAGNCPGQMASLQIEASKWPAEAGSVLFAGYRLGGRTGQADETTCGKNITCVKEPFSSGSMNPLTGVVVLNNGKLVHGCSMKKDQLSCDGCNLAYDPISPHAVLDVPSPYHLSARSEHLPVSKEDGAKGTAQAGEYYGYLHHEQTGAYQLIALNVSIGAPNQAAAGAAVAALPRLSAVGTLYFGEGDSHEFIAYHFNPVPWPGTGPVVLDGDGEAFVVVRSLRNGRIQGEWYAKTFGRVGTVELQLGSVPPLNPGHPLVDKISGLYKSEGWEFELATTANLSEQPTDFYPLKIYGWAREKEDDGRRRNIVEGTYDFYTGSYAFRLDDGRTAVGRLTGSGLAVNWPPKPRYGTPISGTTQVFKIFR